MLYFSGLHDTQIRLKKAINQINKQTPKKESRCNELNFDNLIDY